MKKFFTIIIISLSFFTHSSTSEISDYEIEGISVGDSLLDFFEEIEIKKDFFYKNKKYFAFSSIKYKSENYDGIQFHAKNNDKRYKIVSIEGIKTFDNDFDKCLKLKDKIVKDILKDLGNPKVLSDEGKHVYDSTGKSKYYRTNIMLDPKAKYYNLSVSCTDWSNELEAKFSDKLKVSISNNEFNDYMVKEAY